LKAGDCQQNPRTRVETKQDNVEKR